jgi:hypothetical protein
MTPDFWHPTGVDDTVERLGGLLACGQHADVVDHDQVAAADAGLPGRAGGRGPGHPGPG